MEFIWVSKDNTYQHTGSDTAVPSVVPTNSKPGSRLLQL